MSRRRIAAVALSAVLTASLAAGMTYAMWSSDAEASIGVLRSGNLDLELIDGVQWAETSPDAGNHWTPPRGGAASHLAVPGDTFTVTQRFRTTLEGDNLRARLTVTWIPTGPLPSGVGGTYVVKSSGRTVGSGALGSTLVLPSTALPDGTAEWELVATITWSGADRVVPASALPAQPTTSVSGDLQLDLEQVRTGDGFTTP